MTYRVSSKQFNISFDFLIKTKRLLNAKATHKTNFIAKNRKSSYFDVLKEISNGKK